MKKYKTIFALVLVGSMAFSMAACGGEGNGEEKTSENGGKTELRMIFWDSNQEDGLKAMADGFMRQNPDISVTVETVPWDEYWTKLQAAAQGGDMPDVVVMHPDEVENYASGGVLMDLTDVLNGDVANRSNFPDYIVEDFSIDGKAYAIPKDISTLALYYNKKIFNEAGVEYPTNEWTWEDLSSAAQKLTNKEKGIYGLNADNNGQNFYWNLIWQNEGDVWEEESKVCTFDSPETVEAMEYAVSFVEKGFSPTPAEFANLTADEYFESGKSAMTFAGSWMLTEYQKVEDLDFDVVELPKGKVKAAICSGMGFSVSANTKHPEEAKQLAEYLGSEEAQTIEAESGAAIPAYAGTQQAWVDQFSDFDATPFVKVEEYGHTSPGLTASTNEATAVLDEYMPKIFSLELPVEEGLKTITEKINASLQ